jgi:endonuclease III
VTRPSLALRAWLPRLQAFYGPLTAPPPDPFAVFVWQVLGTKTSAGRRDAALNALRRIPAVTPDAIRKLGRGRLESVIRLCGPLVDQRLAALEAGVDVFRRRPGLSRALAGPLHEAWPAARDLPHLAEADAERILLYGTPNAVIPVDADLSRWALRMGFVEPGRGERRTRRAVRRELSQALPADSETRRQAMLVLTHHARATCVEREPHCAVCPLAPGCARAMEV